LYGIIHHVIIELSLKQLNLLLTLQMSSQLSPQSIQDIFEDAKELELFSQFLQKKNESSWPPVNVEDFCMDDNFLYMQNRLLEEFRIWERDGSLDDGGFQDDGDDIPSPCSLEQTLLFIKNLFGDDVQQLELFNQYLSDTYFAEMGIYGSEVHSFDDVHDFYNFHYGRLGEANEDDIRLDFEFLREEFEEWKESKAQEQILEDVKWLFVSPLKSLQHLCLEFLEHRPISVEKVDTTLDQLRERLFYS
jgi:hypothetical protein